MRKGFNFYRSYYDVAKELNDKDRLAFYDALMKRQFTGVETELTGMAKFAFLSQKHSIDQQIKGYIDKTKDPLLDPSVGGSQEGSVDPSVQEKEKEKEEYTYRSFAQLSISKIEFEKLSEEYTKEQIDSTLDDIENYKDNNKYKSLYLTAKKWLKRNYPKQPDKLPLDQLDPLVRKAIELGYEKY